MQIEFVAAEDKRGKWDGFGFIFIMMRCVSMEMRVVEHMVDFFEEGYRRILQNIVFFWIVKNMHPRFAKKA